MKSASVDFSETGLQSGPRLFLQRTTTTHKRQYALSSWGPERNCVFTVGFHTASDGRPHSTSCRQSASVSDRLTPTVTLKLKTMGQEPNHVRASSKTGETGKKLLRTLPPLVTAAFGIICVVLVSVAIALRTTSLTSERHLQNAAAQNRQLRKEKDDLERRSRGLSRERDGLSWTMEAILQYQTFPVATHCPEKVCRTCLGGWIPFQSSCYLFSKPNNQQPLNNWWNSRDFCRAEEADLVVIESLEEQEFINNHTMAYNDESQAYWIGLKKDTDTWMWVDGTNVTFQYWVEGAMESHRGPCALSLPRADKLANWDKSWCSMLKRWICETRALIKPD